MYQSLNDNQKRYFFNAVLFVFIILGIFIAVRVINSIKEYSYIGQGVYGTNTISVSGKGEVVAIPDTGMFSFTVLEEAKTVADAQNLASKKVNDVIAALKALGVAEKDIKTDSYTSNPKYEYNSYPCVQPMMGASANGATGVATPTIYPCRQDKNVLTGYQVSQSISVKVRKTADAGNILTKVGSFNVSYISGLNFVVDNVEAVQAEARDKAIADAKVNAEKLSKALGVHLTKIVTYSENGNYPMYYSMDKVASQGMGGGVATPPELPMGENKITSTVNIVYEIGQ